MGSTSRPWFAPTGLLARLALLVLLGYMAICTELYFIQDSQVYPRKLTGAILPLDQAIREARAAGLVPWDHPTPGSVSPQGYVQPDFAKPAVRGTLVVFHGNGGWAVSRTEYVDAFTRRGFRVFLYEYPGYGGRPGLPSEATIVPDGRALIRSLDAAGFSPVYVWGESLGSGVAAAVCADATLPVHGLVLLTPWNTIADVALHRFPYIPVRLLMTDKYDSIANLRHFQHPICVIGSANDEIIPPELTVDLYRHLPEPKKMILQPGVGHNDWPSAFDLPWWDDALNFIAAKN